MKIQLLILFIYLFVNDTQQQVEKIIVNKSIYLNPIKTKREVKRNK